MSADEHLPRELVTCEILRIARELVIAELARADDAKEAGDLLRQAVALGSSVCKNVPPLLPSVPAVLCPLLLRAVARHLFSDPCRPYTNPFTKHAIVEGLCKLTWGDNEGILRDATIEEVVLVKYFTIVRGGAFLMRYFDDWIHFKRDARYEIDAIDWDKLQSPLFVSTSVSEVDDHHQTSKMRASLAQGLAERPHWIVIDMDKK